MTNRRAVHWALVGGLALLASDVLLAEDVLVGHDLFRTAPGTSIDFGQHPLPADFFAAGSEPFVQVVSLQGVPLGSYRGVDTGDMDTIVERLQTAVLSGGDLPVTDTIDIELVALALASVEPFRVIVNGQEQLWNLGMGLSPAVASAGTMTITHDSSDGGVFDSTFEVRAFLTFTRACDGLIKTLDLGADDVTFTLTAKNVPWQHRPSGVSRSIPPLTSNLFVRGRVEHDSAGGSHHNVTDIFEKLLAPGEAFYTAMVHRDGRAGLFRVTPFQQTFMFPAEDLPTITAMDFAPSGLLYIVTAERTLHTLDMTNGHLSDVLANLPFDAEEMGISPITGDIYVAVRPPLPGHPRLIRLDEDGVVLNSCIWPTNTLRGVAVSPEGTITVASAFSTGAHLVRVGDNLPVNGFGECVSLFVSFWAPVDDYDYSTNGNVFSFCRQGTCGARKIAWHCFRPGGACTCSGGACIVPGASFVTRSDGPEGSLAIGPFFDAVIPDADEDGFLDRFDNCPLVFNVCQFDANNNAIGDACDIASFALCMDGPGAADIDPICSEVDRNEDALIDLRDWAMLTRDLSRPIGDN